MQDNEDNVPEYLLDWQCANFSSMMCRLEPLVFQGAEDRKAAYASYHRGGRRIHVGMQELGEDMGAAAAAVSSAAGKAVSSTFTLGGLLSRPRPVEAKEPETPTASGMG